MQERDHQAIKLKEQPILSSESTVVGLRLSLLIQGMGNGDACSQEMGCQVRRNGGSGCKKKKKKSPNDSHLFSVDSGRMFTLQI